MKMLPIFKSNHADVVKETFELCLTFEVQKTHGPMKSTQTGISDKYSFVSVDGSFKNVTYFFGSSVRLIRKALMLSSRARIITWSFPTPYKFVLFSIDEAQFEINAIQFDNFVCSTEFRI